MTIGDWLIAALAFSLVLFSTVGLWLIGLVSFVNWVMA